MPLTVFLRGGGDLATGVALRLQRAGLRLIIAELPQPFVVRRLVAFAEAVYADQITVEGVTARRVYNLPEAQLVLEAGEIPVLVDPGGETLKALRALRALRRQAEAGYNLPFAAGPVVLIDGRMTKRPPRLGMEAADLVIGLGPGFVAGQNCHVVIETNRGHNMGRAIWQGAAEADTGVPETVSSRGAERVLRAPADGLLETYAEIGEHLEPGQLVAEVAGKTVHTIFRGVLRGLLHSGVRVTQGLKIGDVDPRDDPRYCIQVSDKSLAVGGGALEAILSRQELRPHLWD